MNLNFAGYKHISVDGYGRLCLGLERALLQGGHNIYPFEIQSLEEKPAWWLMAQGLDFGHVTVQLMPPHEMQHLPGRSVGMSMHESTRLPMGWGDHVNAKCEFLMVPAPWLVPVFQEAGVTVPIEVVPGGIDPDECTLMGQKRNRPYTFMALADRGGRKGHTLVYSAFYKAFSFRNRDVRLVLKCRPGSLPGLDFSYSNDPRVTVWKADVEKVGDVFAFADACINPNHCEGYGMWPREAAACGIRTVVTNWSGTKDETSKWAIPLNDYAIRECGMIDCDGDWAYPSEDELIHHMRWLYENQDQAKSDALKAAQWLRSNRTYAQAADRLVRVLSKWLGGPLAPPDELPTQAEIAATRKSLAELPEFLTGDEDAIATFKPKSNGHLKAVVRV